MTTAVHANFSFDPATHTYKLADGLVAPSVTQILRIAGIGPDFSRVDPEVLERKRALGTLVHEACVVLDEGDDLEWDSLGLAEPYVRAYRKFLVDTRFRATRIEYHTVACLNGMWYGMKLDREGLLNGQPHVLELKTAEKSEPAWGVQLAAYSLGLPRPVAPPFRYQRVAVQLRPNGTYRILTYDDPADEEAFKLALGLTYWKRQRKL